MDAPVVRLHLFDSPTVEAAGARTALPFERRTQVVVLLALRRQWVPRAEIAAMLWPEQDTRLAFANLRKTLFRLPALPWVPPVETQGAALRLGLASDVADFESALRDHRVAEALAAYRGDLLAGFDDGESEAWSRWVGFERDRLRAAWRAAALARIAEPGVEAAEAVALSARLLDADPLDEAALRQHMAALARDGQAGAARAAYRQFVDRLSADLGLAPGAELRALHDNLLGTRPAAGAAAVAAASPADDGFVGRSIELRRIADLIGREECRLLCLVGPGGVGKTRLARRTMQELAPRYADGGVFVALEDIDTPEQLGLRLAHESGIAASVSDDPLGRAIDAWREQELLLVLDNFEQLAEHAAVLQRLLEACPRMKMLVTSRLRLAVADEWSMPLEGLPVPDPEDEDRAESFDAVRLFVRAARRVEPGFAAAAESAAIVDICRQVAGLPLAIELAAGWARMLSCRAIADELRHGTELLRAADPRQPARHASIETVFEHSWRRLGPVEREALARLSVFHGGFSIEGARAVAGASLPVLGALADKSLLAKEADRMHLHPLVQQLAALRLDDDAAARAATEAAHATWFHRWLRQLEPASESGDREALQAIDREFENCRRACQFAIAHGQGETLAHGLPTLLNYFEHRARFAEGLALFQQAIASPLAAQRPLHALLLSQAALMQARLARYGDAEASASRALAATRRGQPRQAKYQALAVLAGCAVFTGRHLEARELYQQVLALAQAGGRAYEIASTLDNLALCEKRLGRYDEAVRLMGEALLQHRRHGDHARVALCLNNLGSMSTFMDDDEAAKVHLREALQLSERHGLVSSRAFVLANLTELALKADDVDAARSHAEAALQVAQGAGLMSLVGWLTVQLARLAARRGERDRARALLADGADLALTLRAQSLKPATLLALAELLEAEGHDAAARRVLAFGADEESLSAPDRAELRAAWTKRAAAAPADPPWPGIALGDLLQRIVTERPLAHAPLIAALQGGRAASP